MSNETVTAIVPYYDRCTRMLGEAIDSILGQTRRIEEVFVVDDGSPEPIASWVRAAYGDQVRVIRIDHAGIGAARNAGIAQASGSLLAFLDSDDVWVSDKTERQLEMLDASPGLDAVYGRAEQFHDPHTSLEHRERFPIRDRVIDAWLSTAQLIRADAFHRIGDYWERPTGVDVDWMMRANDLGLAKEMLTDVVYRRRIHETNIGITDRNDKHGALAAAVRASLARRRSTGGMPLSA